MDWTICVRCRLNKRLLGKKNKLYWACTHKDAHNESIYKIEVCPAKKEKELKKV